MSIRHQCGTLYRAQLLAVLLPPRAPHASMRRAIARRPALLRPLARAPRLDARASTDVVVRVMDADRVKLERAGVVRLAGVRTPTRDVPVCYNREPGVKTRGMLSRGAKVERGGRRRRREHRGRRQVRERDARAGGLRLRDATPAAGLRWGGFGSPTPRTIAKRDQRGLWRPCGDASPQYRSRPLTT